MTHKATTLALAAVTALGVMAVPSARATATAQPGALPGAPTATVTLVTGDRVTMSATPGGRHAYQIRPGAGRDVSFSVRTFAGHTYVTPSDAAPLVGRGLVDRRLFDVTQLLEWGYDDAHRADIPIMTQGGAAPKAATAGRALAGMGLSAARVPKAGAAGVWRDLRPGAAAKTLAAGVTKLWLDGRLSFTLDKSVPQIGAPEAWKKGLTGKGVTVAVLDSGYDARHPDLRGVVTQAVNFSDEPDTKDLVGHGTHVASIVAGSGRASGGKYKGVAPGAKIAFGKVGGLYGVEESDLIAGMEWAATTVKAPVVNISIGGSDTRGLDPVEQAVNTLSERTGTLFVIAAGNSGKAKSINSPGSAEAALTVGAVDHADALAYFSSQGPRMDDGAAKPDITAPGSGIVAAGAKGTTTGRYVSKSGTSMATPHVVGAAAILSQQHPDWKGARLKAALMASAKPGAGLTPYQEGTGRVDVARALTQTVVAETPNVWTFIPWPGGGAEPVTKEITYANTSDAPVDLALAEDGPYTLAADRLTVPARGTASVRLTLDAGLETGGHPGVVTATAGETTVRSLAGAFVEPESYDLKMTATGRDGKPLDGVAALLYDVKTGEMEEVPFSGGAGATRLPRGDWNLIADLFEPGAYTFTHQRVRIDKADVDLALDTRQAAPVRFAVDDPEARPTGAFQLSLRLTDGDSLFESTTAQGRDPGRGLYALPSRQAGLEYLLRAVWESGGSDGSDGSGTARYDLADYRADGIPADPGGRFRRAELAQVTTDLRAQGVSASAQFDRTPGLPRYGAFVLGVGSSDVKVPGTLTDYVTPGLGLSWYAMFTHEDGAYVLLDGEGRPAPPGHSSEVWNTAVAGPAAPPVLRFRDEIAYIVDGLFTDGGQGRPGWDGNVTGSATLAKGRTVLQRADLKICDHAGQCVLLVPVPAGPETYTLNVSARRKAPYAALSTAVQSTWTFRSAHTTVGERIAVPSITYAPEGLDAYNRALPGSVTTIPITAKGGEISTPKVEASFDDGRTWRALPVRQDGKGWVTTVTNPRSRGFVSLRASAGGPDGLQVSQTITRAYAVHR
ncbi:serine protease [Sphaerisporangium krabiense]|uniref:Subtilisin family serine protease n=1 Tax=Sphaerisporangium krabiense TaxID=763782 RepID=A0A7W8ZAK9_9ACTN|nr:S8 family serine peptidase [Sphaerisporangium krabiense]MBB5630522.1 subtilisin family serine protease [Sphaerisporangium krabiense]GII62523.1 serine protease [Sphaerisporangium krabiense]